MEKPLGNIIGTRCPYQIRNGESVFCSLYTQVEETAIGSGKLEVRKLHWLLSSDCPDDISQCLISRGSARISNE
jgi:hypothetical protein